VEPVDEFAPELDPALVPALEPPFEPELGPWVGQECWVAGAVGEAGVCGAGCADCWPDWTVRTGSPACGRAELVVPAPGRPSVDAGTGTVSSVGIGGFVNCPDPAWPFEDWPAAA
jgi:hypothetical protein